MIIPRTAIYVLLLPHILDNSIIYMLFCQDIYMLFFPYSEYVFMDVLWPDFSKSDLEEAVAEYSRRNRRFGGI